MPEKIISTAIIGFGLSGRVFHAPLLHIHPNFEIKKIVERSRQDSKALYPYVQVEKNLEDVLSDKNIELVVVTTPNVFHFSMVKEILKSGKHAVIEKPFTPTSQEADELIKLSEQTRKKIFVYHNRRWDGDFMTVQKLLQRGVLGNINEFEAHFDRYKPEVDKDAWRNKAIPAGGILYDLGSHLIDQALVLFGKPDTIKADIQAQRKGSEVDDYFELILNYKNLKVILKSGMLVEELEPRYILHGLLGSFIKYGIDPQEEELNHGKPPTGDNWGAEGPEFWGMVTLDYQDMDIHGNIETEHGNYGCFYNNVYDVLVNGAEMAINPIEARNVIKLIELSFESNKIKKEVKVEF